MLRVPAATAIPEVTPPALNFIFLHPYNFPPSIQLIHVPIHPIRPTGNEESAAAQAALRTHDVRDCVRGLFGDRDAGNR